MSLVVVWAAVEGGMTLTLLKSILALVGTAVLLLQVGISSTVVGVHGSLWLLSDD